MEFPLALFLSFGPALLAAAFVYWLDRYEKEPKLLLGLVFFWGSAVAAFGALVSQLLLEGAVEAATGSERAADLAGTTVFAPLTEESLKGAAVLLVFLVFRREFDSVLDGLVYAGVVALGFAATEDTLYLLGQAREHGIEGMLELWQVRIVLGIWDHPFYTAWVGLGLAASRLSHSSLVRWLAPPAGWGTAVTAHAVHNSLAEAATGRADLSLLMLFVDWMGWCLMAFVLAVAIWRERRMVRMHLADEVARGVLDERQYRTAFSLAPQTGVRLRALTCGRFLATRRFYRLCGELAHRKNQLACFGDEGGTAQAIEELRQEMARLAPLAGV